MWSRWPFSTCRQTMGFNRDAMSQKTTEEQWDQVLVVNLKGRSLCAQAGADANA